MAKRVRTITLVLLVAILGVSLFAGGQTEATAKKVINVWSFTDEFKMIERYKSWI